MYYYAIKPKQPLGGDTAACVLKTVYPAAGGQGNFSPLAASLRY